MSISGNFKAVNGTTGAATTLAAATGLDFIALTGTAATPGTAGQFLVNSASGTMTTYTGSIGAIRDFSFSGAGSANFPAVSVPLVSFQTVGSGSNTLTFTLSSLDPVVLQTNNVLVLQGGGFFSLAGYSDTPGTFNFTGNGAGGTFSFSSSQAAVPEPATLSLFGVGLLVAAAGLNRRRRRKSA